MKRTLKKESKVPEIVEREDIKLCVSLEIVYMDYLFCYKVFKKVDSYELL